ncbi:MAG: diaminopimelate epimerase [Bacteroidales bacterium]|nr:diaminopimelate epimerase [Bacteroidales bacterium]
MEISFKKMHGAGNDFILINDMRNSFTIDNKLIALMCDRRLGIGADGLILVQSSRSADFRMVYFNADGFEGTMCGNGGRAVAVFAFLEGLVAEQTIFEAVDGLHQANILSIENNNYQVSLSMQDVTHFESTADTFITDTGSLHLVVQHDNVSDLDVVSEGRKLRNDSKYAPHGINVNFIQQIDDGFFVRTYERGVEDETLSCGTGITAAALAVHHWFGEEDTILKARGGVFKVSFTKQQQRYTNIILEGPVTVVYEGIFLPINSL